LVLLFRLFPYIFSTIYGIYRWLLDIISQSSYIFPIFIPYIPMILPLNIPMIIMEWTKNPLNSYSTQYSILLFPIISHDVPWFSMEIPWENPISMTGWSPSQELILKQQPEKTLAYVDTWAEKKHSWIGEKGWFILVST
jgi:hypothetical protein